MANIATSSVKALTSSKKTKKATTVTSKKSAEKTSAHPSASEMVIEAIKALGNKKGTSLQAIKNYIACHYECDIEKQAIFIRKFIRSAVEKKTLVQIKGIGASGSFKLAKTEKIDVKKPARIKKVANEKPKVAKTSKRDSPAIKKTGKLRAKAVTTGVKKAVKK